MTEISRRSVLKAGLFGGAMAAFGPWLAACGNPGSGSVATKTSGQADVHLWTHDDGYIRYFTAMADSVNAKGGSPFTYSLRATKYSSEDLVTKLIAAASANGELPDMVGIEIGQFPRLMNGGIAQNLLTGWNAKLGDSMQDLVGAGLAPYTVDGEVYGMAAGCPACVYYYRTDLFNELNVPSPETWEEFAEFGAKLYTDTGKSLVPICTGPSNVDIAQCFQMFLLQRGGHVFDENGKLTADSPEMLETIEFLANGIASGFVLGIDNFYGGSIQAAFKSDTLLGAVMPDWYKTYGLEATVPEQAGQWEIRPLPKFSGGGYPSSWWGGNGFTAIKDSPNADAVMDLIMECFLTVEGQVLKFQEIGYLPSLRAAYDDPTLLAYKDSYLSDQLVFEVFGPLVTQLPSLYQNPNHAVWADAFGGPLLEAYLGKIDARSAVDQAITAYEQQAS